MWAAQRLRRGGAELKVAPESQVRSGPGILELLAATLLLLLLALIAAAPPALSKVPGRNGKIAFARSAPSPSEDNFTFTVRGDGTHVMRLFSAYPSEGPHWSPHGRRVAVISGLDQTCPPDCRPNTVIIHPGTGKYRVLQTAGYPDVPTFCTLWSPDATHFACEGGNESDSSVNGIYTVRVSDGQDLRRLTNAHGGNDLPIDYSPNGRRIVFGRFDVPSRDPHANSALFIVDVKTRNVRRITPWGYSDDDGSWSPDGHWIAFERRGSMFVVHPNGTGLKEVPLELRRRAFAGDFSFSPNGRKVAFLLFLKVAPHTFREGIAKANVDGTNVRRLTRSTFDHQPDWGADPVNR